MNKSKVETLQVVEASTLDLSNDLYDYLADFYEISNSSYHRYYPDDKWDYIPKDKKDIINQKLKEAGVEFPDVLYREPSHPDGYFSFYILLYFDW
jgi:hypothetical protein